MGSDWVKVTLDEIIDFNPKRTIKKNTVASYIEMAAVPELSREVGYVFDKEYKGGGSRFKNGDVLFARITPCLQNGKTAKVAILNDKEIAHGSTEFIVMSAKENSDEDFIYYLARDKDFRSYAESRMEGSTGRQRVSWQSLAEYQLTLPTKIERQNIAHILGTLDDKIELNRQMNETLEAMAQALFKSWFVDFDPVLDNAIIAGNAIPDAFAERASIRKQVLAEQTQANPYAEHFPSEFEFTEELGWIPKGWSSDKLSNVTEELRRGISPKYTEDESGIPVINQRCIRDHKINFSLCRKNDASLRKVEGRFVEVGDVLINSTGVGTLGRMAQASHLEFPCVVDSHVTIVRPKSSVYKPIFFGRLLLSLEKHVESMGVGSTGQTELSRKDLGELNVLIASSKAQDIADKKFWEFAKKINSNLLENKTLSKLRDTLLPQLLSGKLRIADAEKMVAELS